MLVWNVFGRPVAIKNGENWANVFATGDTNVKNYPLKCLIFQTNEECYTFVTLPYLTFLSNGTGSYIQEFHFEVRFYFSAKKGH